MADVSVRHMHTRYMHTRYMHTGSYAHVITCPNYIRYPISLILMQSFFAPPLRIHLKFILWVRVIEAIPCASLLPLYHLLTLWLQLRYQCKHLR